MYHIVVLFAFSGQVDQYSLTIKLKYNEDSAIISESKKLHFKLTQVSKKTRSDALFLYLHGQLSNILMKTRWRNDALVRISDTNCGCWGTGTWQTNVRLERHLYELLLALTSLP